MPLTVKELREILKDKPDNAVIVLTGKFDRSYDYAYLINEKGSVQETHLTECTYPPDENNVDTLVETTFDYNFCEEEIKRSEPFVNKRIPALIFDMECASPEEIMAY